jgi:hypothetical protein
MQDLELVEQRMQPGGWDPSGFLLPGTSLAQLLVEDADNLTRLALSSAQTGSRLIELVDAASATDFRRPLSVDHYSVEVIRQRGLITCPWAPDEFEFCPQGSGGLPTANLFVLRHRPSGRRLHGFALIAHTIGAHRFFGGPGTRFRIEPDDLISVMGNAAG